MLHCDITLVAGSVQDTNLTHPPSLWYSGSSFPSRKRRSTASMFHFRYFFHLSSPGGLNRMLGHVELDYHLNLTAIS